MIITIGVYALLLGWKFAVGLVLLIFVHELGHAVAAKIMKLPVSAPVFIPFVGAFIMMKDMPKNAWVEAVVGIGGPILGTIGAIACYGVYMATGSFLFLALANMGFVLNLFNLIPMTPLDGGRIIGILSPKFWILGLVLFTALLVWWFNFIFLILYVLIVVQAWPKIKAVMGGHISSDDPYFQVRRSQRWGMGLGFLVLVTFLVLAMSGTDGKIKKRLVEMKRIPAVALSSLAGDI